MCLCGPQCQGGRTQVRYAKSGAKMHQLRRQFIGSFDSIQPRTCVRAGMLKRHRAHIANGDLPQIQMKGQPVRQRLWQSLCLIHPFIECDQSGPIARLNRPA